MEPDEPRLSRSDETILRVLSSGEQHYATLDWVAVQHLRQKGLVEVTPSGPKITDKGRRAISGP
jgi:hypothetical protein